MILSPSILSADFGNLQRELEQIKKAGATFVHIDVMDGHFVPNISMGIPVVKSIRKHSDLIFDVHLMIENPGKYIKDFVEAGADYVTIHYEALSKDEIITALSSITSYGKKCGLSIKPATPFEMISPFLPMLDLVLIMTVEPGFSGQEMMEACLEKVSIAKEIKDKEGYTYLIEVDGGVTLANIRNVIEKGADAVVAGSAVFGSDNTFDRATAMIKEMNKKSDLLE